MLIKPPCFSNLRRPFFSVSCQDVGSSNCPSTPHVHIKSRVPHLARSGAMFATHLGFHARAPNVRSAPSSRNAWSTGRPVTLLCHSLDGPRHYSPMQRRSCSHRHLCICCATILHSPPRRGGPIWRGPTSSHPQADDDSSHASASNFGGDDTLHFLNSSSHRDAQSPSVTTTS